MNDRRPGLVAIVAIWIAVTTGGKALAGGTTHDLGGHVKPQAIATSYPDNSTFRDAFGSGSLDLALDARVVLGIRHESWSFDADLQLIGAYGDWLEFTRQLPEEIRFLFPHLPSDRARLFDLTHVFTDSGTSAVLGRLDRLTGGYTSSKVVVKLGRQAITWGSGLIYTPMDIFNPFDPTAVDKEYKAGDDMLYSQYLLDSGDDLQAVAVLRRDPLTGEVRTDVSSLAVKYHGLTGAGEYDALAARHYGETLVGGGGNRSVGGAVLRGDLIITFTGDDTVPSLVSSLTYAWTWAGRSMNGIAEYFYNGFGRADGCYSPQCLSESPGLVERALRGELFTLGRHYTALSAMIQMHPLFTLTPNLFINLADPSTLLQVVFQYDLQENLVLLSSFNLPIGADGTEFGGVPSDRPGVTFSSGPSGFVQLGWYW